MSDQGKANYEGHRKAAGGKSAATGWPMPDWDDLTTESRRAFDAGADAVEAWLAECPVDEDAPGSEPIGAAGIDQLVKLAEGFDLRYREYSDAANANENFDDSRAQRAIGVAFKKCAAQLRHVIGDLASPTAEDFDRAAEELAKPVTRYALVEQMGFRRTYGTVRETEFAGKPMAEVTPLDGTSVRLVAPESLYQLTWLTKDQAERAVRTGMNPVAAIAGPPSGAGIGWGDDIASWGDDGDIDLDDDGERDTARRMDALDEAARLEAGL